MAPEPPRATRQGLRVDEGDAPHPPEASRTGRASAIPSLPPDLGPAAFATAIRIPRRALDFGKRRADAF